MANARQDQRLLSVMEVVGSHYVDIFFNVLHSLARTAHAARPQARSMTDEYCAQVQGFMLGVKQDAKSYREAVMRLHTYFRSVTSFHSISFAGFVDYVVRLLVPDEYFGDLTEIEKDETLGATICDLIAQMGAFATTPDLLRRIIDDRGTSHPVTVQMMQDHAVNVLIAKRETVRNQFLRQAGQVATTGRDRTEDLKQACRRLLRDKVELEVGAKKLRSQLAELERLRADDRRTLRDERARFTELFGELESLKRRGLASDGAGRLASAAVPAVAASRLGELAADRPVRPPPPPSAIGEAQPRSMGPPPPPERAGERPRYDELAVDPPNRGGLTDLFAPAPAPAAPPAPAPAPAPAPSRGSFDVSSLFSAGPPPSRGAKPKRSSHRREREPEPSSSSEETSSGDESDSGWSGGSITPAPRRPR